MVFIYGKYIVNKIKTTGSISRCAIILFIINLIKFKDAVRKRFCTHYWNKSLWQKYIMQKMIGRMNCLFRTCEWLSLFCVYLYFMSSWGPCKPKFPATRVWLTIFIPSCHYVGELNCIIILLSPPSVQHALRVYD